ncbi:ABC transporter permease [Streptomyces sp. 8K308]|uniref:ABC transporter permease n=1 Tax=Streptomyces sp. 8K308 TaxID=2530388 RepID=UPI00104B61E6|nr:ABC transporter permease [Streptomyces sp. 8K308]TDC24019.1 ABC transporter permease [Streptomyces sp. 8K308]
MSGITFDAGSLRRLRAVGRAELTLLLRSRSAVFVALLMPVGMVAMSYSASREMDLGDTGLTRMEAVLTGGIGTVLMLVVYLGLVPVLVARREERVLKRLRTGELSDLEILAGAALPSVVLALAQCVVLVAAGALLLDVSAPRQPALMVLGVLLGAVLLAGLAAATAGVTRTVDSAQLTGMPLFMVSVVGSGLFVPLEVLPDRLADVFRMLPLTGVVELVSGGWLGGLTAAEVGRAVALALAWTALAGYAVRRWFRWEPRQ